MFYLLSSVHCCFFNLRFVSSLFLYDRFVVVRHASQTTTKHPQSRIHHYLCTILTPPNRLRLYLQLFHRLLTNYKHKERLPNIGLWKWGHKTQAYQILLENGFEFEVSFCPGSHVNEMHPLVMLRQPWQRQRRSQGEHPLERIDEHRFGVPTQAQVWKTVIVPSRQTLSKRVKRFCMRRHISS